MSEIHGAVGSYVVNALDVAEQTEFEAHLATCETCRREVVEFSETAAQLGSLVETAPPPELRASVLSAIREVRPLPPEVSQRGDVDAVVQSTPTPAATAVPVVDELALRRQRRATRLLSLAVAAAMVIALAMGGWVVNLIQDRQAQMAEAGLLTELMTAPDRKDYKKNLNGTPATFVVSKGLNKAIMLARDVPTPGAGKTYQLWTFQGEKPIPDNTFGAAKTQQTWLSGDVQDADGIAVTIEKSGGAQAPTTEPVAQIFLT